MVGGDGRRGQALSAQGRAGGMVLGVLAAIIVAVSAVTCRPLPVAELDHLWPLEKVILSEVQNR